jgi:hypothetical protein
VQSEADNVPEGDGVDRDAGEAGPVAQAETSTARTARGAGGDTQVEAPTTEVATSGPTETSTKDEVPHQPEV